jgi:fructosamine-3-kinase
LADCSFVQIQHGKIGKINLEGEYESQEVIGKIRPSLVPQPLGHGTFATDKDLHYLVTVIDKVPTTLASAEDIGRNTAKLHLRSKNDYKPALLT